MKTHTYYTVRSIVRALFWGAVITASLLVIWLALVVVAV